jgi:hypothetical protein
VKRVATGQCGAARRGAAVRNTIISTATNAILHFGGIPPIGPSFSDGYLNITSRQPLIGSVPGFRRPSSGFPNQRSSPHGYEVVGNRDVFAVHWFSVCRSSILPEHFPDRFPIVPISFEFRRKLRDFGVNNRVIERSRMFIEKMAITKEECE